jgi:hypothetical protein
VTATIKLTEKAVLNGGALVLAATLFISPWAFGFNGVPKAAWTAWIDAPAIAIASFAFSSAEQAKWAILIVGIFTAVSPWVIGFSDTQAATAIHGTIGLVITIMAGARFWLRVAD